MAKRRRNRPPYMERFMAEVMKEKGYPVDPDRPETVKYEVARALGIQLNSRDNGQLTTEAAGKVGGPIGGAMVREMVRIAQEKLRGNPTQR